MCEPGVCSWKKCGRRKQEMEKWKQGVKEVVKAGRRIRNRSKKGTGKQEVEVS
jgi:hypothetical protein